MNRISLKQRKLGGDLITSFMGVKSHSSKGYAWHGLKQWFTGLPTTYINNGEGSSIFGANYERVTMFQYKDLRYDCDWNWLMPVIDKIDLMDDIHFSCDIHKSSDVNVFNVKVFGIKKDSQYPLYAFIDVKDEDKLTAHYKAVVQLLLYMAENKAKANW